MIAAFVELALYAAVTFWIIAIIESHAVEWLAGHFSLRGRMLRQVIVRMLGEQLGEKFYAHDLIRQLARKGRLPSYLEPETFARVFLAISSEKQTEWLGTTGAWLEKLAGQRGTEPLSAVLRALLGEVDGAVSAALPRLSAWFQQSMDRAQGEYRRTIRWPLIGVGFFAALGLNCDLFGGLASLGAGRSSVDTLAQKFQDQDIAAVLASLSWGWTWDELLQLSFKDGVRKVLGCFVVAVAGSIGAPFWFDLAGRLVGLRSAGKKPDAAPTEARAVLAAAPDVPKPYGGGPAADPR